MKDVQKTRVAVRRRKKKRIKVQARFYYILVTLIVVVAAFVLSRTVFFNLTEVKVEGGPYTAEQIMQTCGIEAGDNLFSIKPSECERLISDNLVNAEKVTVKRSLPSTLKVTVTEAVPAMNILAPDGTYYVVSESMRVLAAKAPQPKDGIITVYGCNPADTAVCKTLSGNDGAKLELVSEIMEAVAASELKNAKIVDVSSQTDIIIYYTDNLKIQIGDITNLDYKLTLAETIMAQRGNPDEAGTINVSKTEYPSFYGDRQSSAAPESVASEDEPDEDGAEE